MNEKNCIICGKLFQPTASAQKICSSIHYRSCVICGKSFRILKPSDIRRCCSTSCSVKLRESTMVDRYGVTQPFKSAEFLEKRENTNLLKFGYKHAAQSPKIREKERCIFQEHYGVDTPFLMSDFKDKSKATCLEKYGVEYTSQIPTRKKSKSD